MIQGKLLPAVGKESRNNHGFAEQSQFNYGSRPLLHRVVIATSSHVAMHPIR
jgi:hypothetical protein